MGSDFDKEMEEAQKKAQKMIEEQTKLMQQQAAQMMELQQELIKQISVDPAKYQELAMQAAQFQANYAAQVSDWDDDEDEEDLEAFIAENAPPAKYAKYLPIGALLIGTHGEPYETLALIQDKEDSEDLLEEGWGIENKKDGIEMLNSLLKGRHANKFKKAHETLKSGKTNGVDAEDIEIYNDGLEFIEEILNIPKAQAAGSKTLLGWDLERVGYLAKIFANVGYITEDEAWEWIGKAAVEVKKNFTTWEDYIVSILLGRGFAMGISEETYAVARDLLVESRGFLDSHPIKDL
jgi:hypothetical protein